MSRFLLSKIASTRRKHHLVALASGTAGVIAAGLLALGVGMLLDWWLDLPSWIRAGFLALDCGLVALIVWRDILSPILFGPDDDRIALLVEDAEPSFRTRLIASIQLTRPGAAVAGASTALIQAMVAQAEHVARGVNFERVVKTNRLVRLTLLAALVFLLAAAAFVRGAPSRTSTDLLKRALLFRDVAVPRKTRIDVISGSQIVARGENVSLRARAAGIVPANGSVEIRFDSKRRQDFPLDPAPPASPDAGRNIFVRELENVQDSFAYRVDLGDSVSKWHRIDVLIPPAVTKIDCQQLYPPYTGLGSVARSLGDLSILGGSQLRLRITANNVLRRGAGPDGKGPTNHVHLVGAERDVEMAIDEADPRLATVTLPIPEKTTGFAVHLVDEHGLRSRDPAVYRIDLVPDKEPQVKVLYPERKEELITRVATVEIGFDASDDFGIAQMLLKYKVDDGPEQSRPILFQGQPRVLRNRIEWRVADLPSSATTRPSLEGSTIEWWLEAVDNNNVTGPGVGASEHYSARVVSEAEKRAEILARLNGSFETVKGGAEDQEKLHNDLGALILGKPRQP